MVDYRKTGKYVQTPPQDPTDIYVGKPEEVDYSGKSTRIDDNFTYIASQIGGPEKYHPGVGMTLTASSGEELDTFNIDTGYLGSFVAAAITGKQDTLVPGANISIDENNVISIYGISQYQEATTEDAGLMSAEDKEKLDGIAENANNYVLTPATQETLGGIIVGDNLTIDNGILSAVNTTYEIAIPSVNGYGGTAGLLSGPDKEKLDSVQLGANRVTKSNTNGYIVIDNTSVEVYRHPSYDGISGTIPSGKLINGITVDDTGHVLGYSTTNETGVNLTTVGVGNTIVDLSYNTLYRTLTATKNYIGSIQVGVVDSTTTGTTIEVTDSLSTAIKKVQNSISIVNNSLSEEVASKLQYKGTITDVPNNAANGDMYKAVASFNVGADSVVNGDILIYSNSSWVKIPSGEKADTWRPVYVGSTQVLSSDDGLPLRITGSGATIVSYSGGNVVIYTPEGSGGGGGTGTITYSPGDGLTLDAESTSTHKIFDVVPATTSSIGGVIVGSGISLNDGVISVPVISGDGTSVNVNNGVISLVRGQNTAAQVPEGNHSHLLGNLENVKLNNVAVNQVLTYVRDSVDTTKYYWSNVTLPTQYEYTAGSDNVTVNNTTHTIAVKPRRFYWYDTTGSSPIVRELDDDPIVFMAGTDINISVVPNSDIGDYSDINLLTITNTGDSSGGGSSYVPTPPITITSTSEDNVYAIGLACDNTTIGLSNNSTLEVKAVPWSKITNPPTITDTNTWRNINALDSLDNVIMDLGSATTTGTLQLKAGNNVSLAYAASNNVHTLTISATGGSGPGPSYTAGTGIDITSTVISAKVKSGGGIAADSDGLYFAYSAGNGIAIESNAIKVNSATNGGLKLVTENNVEKLAVNFDGSTIQQRNGILYVDHAEQTSGYVENNSSSPTYNSATATANKIQNNTIYRFTNTTDLRAITINEAGLASDFQYATVCFQTAPSTASTPTTWSCDFRCIGFDCAYDSVADRSVFTPLVNKEYQIAIDKIGTVVTGYVLRIG